MEPDHEDLPGRSFLTKSNREFLLSDPEEYSANERRQHRYQIRQNLKSAIMDFSLLWRLNDADIIRAMGPLAGPLQSKKIDQKAVEQDPILGDIDLEEIAEDEQIAGEMMSSGLMDFFALFSYLFDPDIYTVLADRGLKKGIARRSLKVGEEMDMYGLELQQAGRKETIAQLSDE